MINAPTQEQLNNLPQLYDTQHISLEDKIVHLHFTIDQSHWWAMEWDGENTFFGYVLLNGWMQDAELGYFTLSELQAIRLGGVLEVINDPNWEACPVKDIGIIRETLQFRAMAR